MLSIQVTEDFEEAQIQSRGFGILDVGYRSKVTRKNLNFVNVLVQRLCFHPLQFSEFILVVFTKQTSMSKYEPQTLFFALGSAVHCFILTMDTLLRIAYFS